MLNPTEHSGHKLTAKQNPEYLGPKLLPTGRYWLANQGRNYGAQPARKNAIRSQQLHHSYNPYIQRQGTE